MKKIIASVLCTCFVVLQTNAQNAPKKESDTLGIIFGISISILLYVAYVAIKKRFKKEKEVPLKRVYDNNTTNYTTHQNTTQAVPQINKAEQRKQERLQLVMKWEEEVKQPDITIHRVNEIYEALDENEYLCPIVKNKLVAMTNELLKNQNLTLAELEHIESTYIFSNSPEEKIVQDRIMKIELTETMLAITKAEASKNDEDVLLQILEETDDEDSILYYRVVELLASLYLTQIKDAEEKLYGPVHLSEDERAELIELVDKIAEGNIDCAAKTIAENIVSDDYAHDNIIEQEILSPETTLDRLQEIEDNEQLDDDTNEMLQEKLHEKTLQRILVIKNLLDQPISDDDRESYIEEIEDMLQYVGSETSAEILGNILTNN